MLSLPLPDSYYFWALQNGFVGSADAFYMGLQPYGSCPGGGNCPAALFSFFGEGATSTSPSCVSGADGGPGESCLIAYNWMIGRTYRFTATLTDSSPSTETWTGTVTDTEAHITTTIGSWTILAFEGLIGTQGISWTEYYEPVDGGCAQQPYAKVRFGFPVGFNNLESFKSAVFSTMPGSPCPAGETVFKVGDSTVTVKTGKLM